MKVGVYFTASKQSGGVYQYSVTMLEALSKVKGHQYIIFTTSKDIPAKLKKKTNLKIVDISSDSRDTAVQFRDKVSSFQYRYFPSLFNIIYKLGLFNLLTPVNKLLNQGLISKLKKYNLELIFYPTTSNLSFLLDIPSVVTVHDLHHRITPEFKETSAGGRWEFREYTYQNIKKKAYRILTESDFGKKYFSEFYDCDPERIVVLKMLAPSYLNPRVSKTVFENLKTKYKITDKYLFYPAKFWPHKNHIRIIKALKRLKDKSITPDLILSGSKGADFSTYEQVMKLASMLGVDSQVKYLGYVSDEEMSALYKNAIALIMPTFFGPSNIPLLEAWKIGAPVIYTNIEGCRHELGDAGLLINPKSIKDIADKIEKMYTNPGLRRKVVKKGKVNLNRWTKKDYHQKIREILNEYSRAQNS